MIEITITGIPEAVKKIGNISEALKGVITTAVYEASTSLILPQIQRISTREYVVDIDIPYGRVDITPSIDEFQWKKESEKRKAAFMWREYRHAYWHEVESIIGKAWPKREELEQILNSTLPEVKDIIVGKIKDLVRIS